MCQRLLIPYGNFPTDWDRGYVPYEDASATLDELATIAPVVTLSNMAVTGGPERVAAVRAAHGHQLEEVYTSYRLGGAKPEPWLWRMIADRRGVHIDRVVHIGDRLDADVYGAYFAGARVVHLRKEGSTVYPPFSGDHIRTVFRLSDAAAAVRAWAGLSA
ncbi:HAD-IA family hydrolase [Amycolatopsis minnesotensis]